MRVSPTVEFRDIEGPIMMRLLTTFIALALAATVASAENSESRLNTIGANKLVKVAYRTDAKPFSYPNERNEPDGYTVDLCKLIVRSLEKQVGADLKIEWVPVTTDKRFEVVANGGADMECGASTVTLNRMKQVDFSSYIFVENTGLVVRRVAGLNSFNDLAGKKIAVIAGTSNERAIAARNQRLGQKATIVPVKDRDEGIAALESASVDAFASDKLLLVGAQFTKAETLVMLPDDLSIEPYAIVLPRGDWALRAAVNTGLARIYSSGEIMGIFNKWFAPVGLRPTLLLGAVYALGAMPE
jgi:ABC-type amino acid transport substrate-binding protein